MFKLTDCVRETTVTAEITGGDRSGIWGTVAGTEVAVGVYGEALTTADAFTTAMDECVTAEGYVRVGDWTQLGPARYTAPIQAHPHRCVTCVYGCACRPGSAGCAHYGCLDAPAQLFNTCPGVAAVSAAGRWW